MKRRQMRAERDVIAAHNRVIADALVTAHQLTQTLRHDLAIAEDALEAERQWRLTSLPALLAAEARAVKAEAEVERIKRVGWAGPGYALVPINTDDRPWAAGHRNLAAAYHAETERP